jgi:hypothetical protein
LPKAASYELDQVQEFEMNNEIRDKAGRLIGKIVVGTSRTEVRDARGVLKGFYVPAENVTRTPSGAFYARGDALSRML